MKNYPGSSDGDQVEAARSIASVSKQNPICGPCCELIDDDDAWELWETQEGCWRIVPKKQSGDNVGLCKSYKEPIPIRNRNRNRSRSAARNRSRSPHRQPQSQPATAVATPQPNKKELMKCVKFMEKMVQKKVGNMKVELGKLMTFVRKADTFLDFVKEALANESASTSQH